MSIGSLVTLQFVPGKLRMACMGMIGVVLGLAMYVAMISNAASYLSDDPKACLNCHIMVPQYATWQRSSHARVATCNDCHVPHDSVLREYYFHAKDGLRHSVLFTLRMERQVLEAIPESKEVIQQNCVRCHATVLSEAGTPTGHAFDRSCISCHREVPHGRTHSLSSTPNAAVPPLGNVTPDWMRGASPSTEKQK